MQVLGGRAGLTSEDKDWGQYFIWNWYVVTAERIASRLFNFDYTSADLQALGEALDEEVDGASEGEGSDGFHEDDGAMLHLTWTVPPH